MVWVVVEEVQLVGLVYELWVVQVGCLVGVGEQCVVEVVQVVVCEGIVVVGVCRLLVCEFVGYVDG